jgi:hypothetical protein
LSVFLLLTFPQPLLLWLYHSSLDLNTHSTTIL